MTGARARWAFAAGCAIVRAMETRRWVRGVRGGIGIIAVASALGCDGDDTRRFTMEDVPARSDLGGSRDASDMDADDADGVDANLDAGLDSASDAGGLLDVRDAGLRDATIESSVIGCSNNADCPSPDLYCNGAGCSARGFCVPRRTPGSCPMVDAGQADLVCGCDGMTYGSVCQLQVEGVRLRGFGLCPRD